MKGIWLAILGVGLGVGLLWGMFWIFHPQQHEVPVAGVAGSEHEGEGDAPPLPPDPAWQRRTSWNALDEVGTNHRCNQDPGTAPQNETTCAADPGNPDFMLAGANDYRNGHCMAGFYRSTDGGQTWADALITQGPTGAGTGACDPTVAIDATGRMYAAYLMESGGSSPGAIYVQTSADHGQTWLPPVLVCDGNTVPDKPMAVCDLSPASPYYGTYYIAWRGIHLSRSTDGGQSFSSPQVLPPYHWDTRNMACPAIAPNGDLYLAFRILFADDLYISRSTDGGVTWSPPTTFVTSLASIYSTWCGGFRMWSYPVLACDLNSRLYMCWTTSEPDIYVATSENGWAWSTPVRVNDHPGESGEWFPWMAVHPQTGDVAVSWLDRRDDSTNCRYACYGSISSDGGQTWARNRKISEVDSDPGNVHFLGDYTGLTFSRRGFYSVWPDLRNDGGDAYGAWWNCGTSVIVTHPNRTDTVFAGVPTWVRWSTVTYLSTDTARIELTRDYPHGGWEPVGWAVFAAESARCTFTGPLSAHCRVRLVTAADSVWSGISGSDFVLQAGPPQRVTVRREGDNICLRWEHTGATYYRVYSGPETDGPYTTLEGSTTGTVFSDLDAASDAGRKYYIVRTSTEP